MSHETLHRLLVDPPKPHAMGETMGVWSTEDGCYRLMADLVAAGTRTLETGCGLSTALLVALGAQHCCVTPVQTEADELRRYLRDREIPDSQLEFVVEPSHVALPRMTSELDLVFIDGDHGFPMPMIDWYYAAGRLREGGVAILDDTQLRAVAVLAHVLDQDTGWERVDGSRKWIAFRRLTSGPLPLGRWEQPSVSAGLLPARDQLLARVRRTIAQRVRR